MKKIEQKSYIAGYDGESFFCVRCGKSGFRSEMAVRGHQNVCKGGKVKDFSGVFKSVKQEQQIKSVADIASTTTSAGIDELVALRVEVQRLREDLNRVLRILSNDIPHILAVQNGVGRGGAVQGLVKGLAGYFLLVKTRKKDYLMKLIGIGLLGWGIYDVFGDAGVEKMGGIIVDSVVKSFAKAI